MSKTMHVITSGYIPKDMKWDTQFDKVMKAINKKGITYSQWQQEKYSVKARYKNGQEQN